MQNNVKRSDKIIYYKPMKEEEEAGGDLQQFLSFLLVFAGIMMRVKISVYLFLVYYSIKFSFGYLSS